MYAFEIVVAMLLVGAGLTALSKKIGTAYPPLLALAGAAVALVPNAPRVVLDPELALTLFVAPVLLDTAFDASQRDIRANWRIVAGLALGVVVLTVAAVAALARELVPEMPWSVAIALGAIVAPTDATSATAVLRQLNPPHRILVILEGENLFNDASALLIYRLAIRVAVVGALSPATVIPLVVAVGLGSVVLGIVCARVAATLLGRIEDVGVAVVAQFCTTFAVWILADRLQLSSILTVVVFAMSAARRTATSTPARVRVPSYAVWEFAVFVLNVLAFLLVGLQLKDILGRLQMSAFFSYLGFAALVCVATLLARFAWVIGIAAISRWRCRPAADGTRRKDALGLSPRAAVVVGWCGMRGIVTLAAAFALPALGPDGSAFPHRDLIVFTAFAVVLATLVLQGMTLRPLIGALGLDADLLVEREVRLARAETLRTAIATTEEFPDQELAFLLRRRFQLVLQRTETEAAALGEATPAAASPELRSSDAAVVVSRVTTAQRQRLLDLRADGTIGDAAFQQVEQELDLEELDWQQLTRGPG